MRALRHVRNAEALERLGRRAERLRRSAGVCLLQHAPDQQIAGRRVERPAQSLPQFARLSQQAHALSRLDARRSARLKRRRLPDRVVKALGEIARLLRRLAALLESPRERERQRARETISS